MWHDINDSHYKLHAYFDHLSLIIPLRNHVFPSYTFLGLFVDAPLYFLNTLSRCDYHHYIVLCVAMCGSMFRTNPIIEEPSCQPTLHRHGIDEHKGAASQYTLQED